MLSLIAFTFVNSTGCGRLLRNSANAIPYSTNPPADSEINIKAEEFNSHGLRAFHNGNLPKAEDLFRKSLAEDASFGPAHNNLGQIYLARHQLYLAAWEFEYAANLMPALVEPIINQGLAYETGERIDRAIVFYEEAYNREPQHPVAIASLVRAKIKQDAPAHEIAFLLDEVIMHDSRQVWIEWAKELKATRYRKDNPLCEPTLEQLPLSRIPKSVYWPTEVQPLQQNEMESRELEFPELLSPQNVVPGDGKDDIESTDSIFEPLSFGLMEQPIRQHSPRRLPIPSMIESDAIQENLPTSDAIKPAAFKQISTKASFKN